MVYIRERQSGLGATVKPLVVCHLNKVWIIMSIRWIIIKQIFLEIDWLFINKVTYSYLIERNKTHRSN